MINRGADANTQRVWRSEACPDRWVATENGMLFEFRLDEGTSPGLFLDQRDRRLDVRATTAKMRVLNRFAYTGGFSVAAALGGASEVVTVDISKKYIAWTQENFKLNGLQVLEKPTNDEPRPYEFWSVESEKFLEGAIRRGRKFDLVICDPPSFSRSSKGVFRVEKDYPKLLGMCVSVLAPRGRLIFSTNYQGWTQSDFQKRMQPKILGLPTLQVKFPKTPADSCDANGDSILKTAEYLDLR